MSESFEKEADFEAALIGLLRESCGWGDYPVLKHPTERDLVENWARILFENNRGVDRLGDAPLTATEMGQILDKVKVLRTPARLNEFINGKTVGIVRDSPDDPAHLGKTVYLRIYDRLEIAAGRSRYQIAEQPRFATDPMRHDRRGDFMLLINGMPVIHVELKRSRVPASQAAWQIRNYAHDKVFTGLFSLVQVFVAMSPEETLYFANPGPDAAFNEAFFFHWADFNNEPVNDWRKIARDLLSIPMAHQLIGFYTVADDTDGTLKVMRSYQYYAARAVTNRVAEVRWADRELYGGYVWHTTGSGKTLTSFKCAQLVSESGHADKVVFLLNRIELGNQTYEAFQNFADDATDVQQTENTAILFGKLKSDAGADSLIVTSIQKMSRIREDPTTAHDLAVVRRKRIVFIVDECHADTFGEMLATIKATFPAAIFFGFSGTPILEENEKKGCSTADIFGNELHRYSIADGIRDRNVLGFDPNKVLTFPDADLRKSVALEKARAKTEEEALADEAKRRIYQKYMALPMAGARNSDGTRESGIEDFVPESQYRSKDHSGKIIHQEKVVEHIRGNWRRLSVLGKFHAILATSSIPEAFEYYNLLKREMPELKATVIVDDSIDNDGGGAAKEDELVAVLEDYNARYGKKFTLKTFAGFKRDVSARLAHKKPYRDIGLPGGEAARLDLVVVVNQMLTGYDSKWVNTLYLDKTLEYARVIQSFSRTNRLFGPDKPFGTIFYYRRPHTMEKNIEDAIKLYSGDRPLGVFVNRLGNHLKRLDALFAEIRDIFRRAGAPDLSRLPEAEEERSLFAKRFNELSSELSAARVQGFRWDARDYEIGEDGEKQGYTVGFDETEYLALLQRYKELAGGGGGGGGGGGDETPPFDIRPTLVEIDTGMVDSGYMDAKFGKFLRALADGEDATQVLADLHRSFATLSQEEQKFAQQVLDDVQNGRLAPDPGRTLSDYITAYEKRAKDDRIHRFALAFGADETALRELMDAQPEPGELNAYGRFDALVKTVDPAKAAAFFTALEGRPVSVFAANLETDRYFRKFILTGGFPLPDASAGKPVSSSEGADTYEYAEAAGKGDSKEKGGDGYQAV